MEIKDLGERKLINLIHRKISQYWQKPIYDDAVFFQLNKRKWLVSHTNVANASSDFIKGMDYYSFGWKITISNLSDIACKGAKPYGILFSISLPKNLSLKNFKNLIKGICDASKENYAIYMGGDISLAKELSLAGFSFGFAKKVIKREGAKKNDLIATTGKFGLTSIAYKIIFKKAKYDLNIKNKALISVFRPKGRIKESLAISNYLNCCMDISDGLAISLHQLCEANKMGAIITNIPIYDEVFDFCKINNYDPLNLVLYEGGEEYELLFTFNESKLPLIKKALKKIGCDIFILGRIVKERKIKYVNKKQKFEILNKGWEHFKYWEK